MRSRRMLAAAFPATVAAVLLGAGWPGGAGAGPPPASEAACGPALALAARFQDPGARPRDRRGWLRAIESLEILPAGVALKKYAGAG